MSGGASTGGVRICVATLALLVSASVARAAPSVDQNAGRWFDTFGDAFGLAPSASGLTREVEHEVVGGRLVLAPQASVGTFASSLITPASSSGWGTLAIDRTQPSGSGLALWLLDPASDVLYGRDGAIGTRAAPPPALVFGANPEADATGLREVCSIGFLPASLESVRVYGRLSGEDVSRPALNALRVTWTPRSVVSLAALAAPTTVEAGGTIALTLNVAVSYVDAANLVVRLPLPSALANPRGQDQRPFVVTASDGGGLEGTTLTWRLGRRKAGQTFTLRAVLRVPSGLVDGTRYVGSGQASADDAAAVGTPSFVVSVASRPHLQLDRGTSGLYVVGGARHALADSAHEVDLWLFNGGNETLFDGVVVEDLGALVAPLVSGESAIDPDTLVVDGGAFVAADTVLPSGFVVPANHIYWELAPLAPGRTATLSYHYALRGAASIPAGTTLSMCADGASSWPPQVGRAQAAACDSFTVPVPATPSAAFALGEVVRGNVGISNGDDLGGLGAGHGEVVGYLFHAANDAVSELDDIVMLGKVPVGATVASGVPPADGALYWYAEPDGFAAQTPPGFDPASGALGAGWSEVPPTELNNVSWVAFRVPKLASIYFPGGAAATAVGELRVVVDPPVAACPSEATQALDGYFHAYGYTPQGGVATSLAGAPLTWQEAEVTRIVPERAHLAATLVASPQVVPAGGTVNVALQIPNASPPGTGVPLDDALDLHARIAIPTVEANGRATHLRAVAIDAPGAAITWQLPSAVELTWAQPLAPGESRSVNLQLGAPAGILAGSVARLSAEVDARDDRCGAISAEGSTSVSFSGSPELQIAVDGDFGYGKVGTQVVYDLRTVNPSLTPTTGTWIVDKPAAGIAVTRIAVPPNGEVWVSTRAPGDGVPRTLSPAEPFDLAMIRRTFTRLSDDDHDGFVRPTTPPTYVAFAIDDGALVPPQRVTGAAPALRIEATIIAGEAGGVLSNQAAIGSAELSMAVGTPADFLVTPRPGLRLSLACPEVAAAQEVGQLTVPFYNDSANASDATSMVLELPEGLSAVSASVTWNDAYLATHPGAPAPALVIDGAVRVALGGLGPLEGGTLTVMTRVDYHVASGTFLTSAVLGDARAGDTSAAAYDACVTLVENADLDVRVLTDNPSPRAGETVGYTLLLANQGVHAARELGIDLTLAQGLGYVAGSALVTPSPWALLPVAEPTMIARSLYWSAPGGQALTFGDDEPAAIRGLSSDLALRFQATVGAAVLPGTTLQTCGTVATSTTDDGAFPNLACVSVTTPLPDPFVTLSAPTVAAIDGRVTYTLRYGNRANEIAAGVVVVLALADLSYLGSVTSHGEATWFHSGTSGSAVPVFDRNDPAAGGWVARPGPAVRYLAFVVGRLDPYATPRTIELSVDVRDPAGGVIMPGSTFTSRATVSMRPGLRDGDDANNTAAAVLRVPGVDLALHAMCAPSGAEPGVLPGERFVATFELESAGSERAHGLGLDLSLPAGVTRESGPAPFASVVDAQGRPSAPIDLAGRRVERVPWTWVGERLLLGSADPHSPLWYRRVGLRPGDRARAELTVVVGDEVANRMRVAALGSVLVDYVEGFDPAVDEAEQVVANNAAECGVTVRRADVMVHKSVVNRTTGSRTEADPGDVLGWTIAYDNIGEHGADAVVIEDAVPEGLAVIVDGVTNVDGEVAVSYSNDGGASFDYVPHAAAGTPDASITHVRLSWRDGLSAPAGAIFIQTSSADFAAGVHDNTRADALSEGVVPVGANVCAEVTCSASTCALGTYVPAGECCPVCRPAVADCRDAPVTIDECARPQNGDTPRWTGCYVAGDCSGQCRYPPSSEEDDSQGRASGRRVREAYDTAAPRWMNCMREGGDCEADKCIEAGCDPAKPLWAQAWRAKCPVAPMYECAQNAWVDTCYSAVGTALEVYAKCLELGLGQACAWLAPGDDCASCLVNGCAATPGELRTWGNTPWWVYDYFRGGMDHFIGAVIDAGAGDSVSGFLPHVPLEACALPAACGDKTPRQCDIDCPNNGQLCLLCPNGAACQRCLSGGAVGTVDDPQPECGMIQTQWAQARDACAASARERVDQSKLPDERRARLLASLLAECDRYSAPNCDVPAACVVSSYTSPVFPEPAAGQVTSWRQAVIDDAGDALSYSVLDADSGAALPGLAGIASPEDGVIDLSGVSPTEHPRLRLKVDFQGGGGGNYTPIENPDPDFDDCSRQGQVYIEPWHIDTAGRVTGVFYACTRELFWFTKAEGAHIVPPHPYSAEATKIEPYGVSNDGRIAANWTDNQGMRHGLLWDPSGDWTDIEQRVRAADPRTLVAAQVADVNAAGEVIGLAQWDVAGTPVVRPFVWSALTGLVTLDLHVHQLDAWGMRINEAGVVAGTNAYSGAVEPGADNVAQVYSWTPASGEVSVLSLPNAMAPTVRAQNAAGHFVVGGYVDGLSRSWFMTGNTVLVVPRPDPKDDSGVRSANYTIGSYGLDDRGQVVGAYGRDANEGLTRGFVWSVDGGMKLIPEAGEAYAIAADGTVLAGPYGIDRQRWASRLFLSKDGRRREVNVPSTIAETWPHWYAWDGFVTMNDRLQIVGMASPADHGTDIAFLWEPSGADELGVKQWKVDYRTDRHPTFGLDTEVGDRCADTLTNRVSIATTTPQIGSANDVAEATIALNQADLEVTTSVDVAATLAGEPATYTVTWKNLGPSAARGIDLLVRGPDLLITDGELLVLDDGALAVGQAGSRTFAWTVPHGTAEGTSFAVSAAISAATLDCQGDNDSDSATVVVGNYPNLWTTLAAPRSARIGAPFEAVLAYGNNGNGGTGAVTVTFEIPQGLRLVSATGDPIASGPDGLLTWRYPDGMGIETYTQTLTFVADDCAVAGELVAFAAKTVSSVNDLDAADDAAAASTLLLEPAGELAVALTPSRSDARAGEVVAWTLHLANDGDTTVFEPRVEVALGTLALAPGALAPGLARVGQDLVWTRATLGPGEVAGLVFDVVTPSGAALALRAVATGRDTCATEASDTLAIAPGGVHVAIAPAIDGVCPALGGVIDWVATVSNDGTAARDVQVRVEPGPGMAFVPGRFSGPGVLEGGWDLAELAAGAVVSFGFTTVLDDLTAIETPAISQAVRVRYAGGERVARGTVAHRCRPTLAVSQRWDALCALAGAPKSLVVNVHNGSAVTAEGVTLAERLPEALSFVSAPGATWDAATRRVSASLGQLRPGASKRVVIGFDLPAAVAPGSLYTSEVQVSANGVSVVANRLVGGALVCDDGNACTTDACTPSEGCVYPTVANGATCDDGNACTSEDACGAGVCAGATTSCDDHNPCTTDSCDAELGCRHVALADGVSCDDGDRCTSAETCGAGVCRAGAAVVCAAAASCHAAGVCDPASGACTYAVVVDGSGCDDGDRCSTGDRCEAGACSATNAMPCACGDTWIVVGEQCDDGNTRDGDGCSAACSVEAGWQCFGYAVPERANPGGPCTKLDPIDPTDPSDTTCGDGTFEAPEHCDDGNAFDGDGCSVTCQVETGWECLDPRRCHPVCGDGVLTGGQGCDDGNARGADGCSVSCAIEPGWSCPYPGVACVADAAFALRDDTAVTLEATPVDIAVTDNDAGRDVLVTGLTAPAYGVVELVDAFTVRYTPNLGFAGQDRFSYEAFDADGHAGVANVSVGVTGVGASDFRIAYVDQVCDTLATYRIDLALVGGSGAFVLDGTPVGPVFRVVEPAGIGASHVIADRSASPNVTPKTISGQVQCPVPAKAFSANGDVLTDGGSVDVLANDEGAGLRLASVAAPAHGKAALGAVPGTISYVPDAGFAGEERILYRALDEHGVLDAAELVVTVAPGDVDARDDRAATTIGQPVTLDIRGNDLGNASDDTLTAPEHGTVRRDANGLVTYTPTAGFVGEDSFTYSMKDDIATVRVLVSAPGACLPITTAELVPTCDSVVPNPGDPGTLTVALDVKGGSGVYTVDGSRERLTLHSAADVRGPTAPVRVAPPRDVDATFESARVVSDTSIRVSVRDAAAPTSCPPRVLSTRVDCADPTPLEAIDDRVETRAMLAVLVRPLGNDRGVGLTTSSIGRPSSGTLEALELGVYRYTPAPGFIGTDKIAYAVRDARGKTDGGVVELRVSAHDPKVCEGFAAAAITPVCSADLAKVAWDFDIVNGSGVFRVDGAVVDDRHVAYSAASGAPIFVRVEDVAAPECGGFTVLARHTCTAPPRAPFATPDHVAVVAGRSAVFDPLGNDLGEGLVMSAMGRPASGGIRFVEQVGWVYAPQVDFRGVDVASYTVKDGAGRTSNGRVTFYVNDPVAIAPGCQTCALAAVDERLRLTIGERGGRDVLSNDIAIAPKLVDYWGQSANEVQVVGSTFTVTGVRVSRAERIMYRVTDVSGAIDEGVLVIDVGEGPACEAKAGAILAAPPAGCGTALEAIGYESGTGYAQAFVVTDLADRVVAVQNGATFVTALAPGDYRVRALNWRVMSEVVVPLPGEPLLALAGCAQVSAPIRYTELEPITVAVEAVCEGGHYQLAMTAAGGEPALGFEAYQTELSAAPPFQPGQVVFVTVSDDAGCTTTTAATMPTAPCGGTP